MINLEHSILLDKLLTLPVENEIVEFKEAKNQFDKDDLGKYFSALANEANLAGLQQAWLIFGVKNDKSIVGTSINDKQLNEYKAEIGRHTSPRCSFVDVHSVKRQGKTLLMLEIPAAPQGEPVSWKGHRYGRDGESLVALSDTEYERIKSQKNAPDWSAKIIETATIDDLDEEATAVARTKYKDLCTSKSFYSEIDKWDDVQFLDKAKITINGKITNTAILLLGKEESTHYLLPSVAEMTWKLDTEEKSYEHFSTPFLLTTTKLMQRIRNIKCKFFPDNELLATTVDKYDTRSILEALNNSIAHQDYHLNSRIIVTEQIDKLIFSNAGNFFEGKPDDYSFGNKTPAKYRNPWLAAAMVNLGMIDRLGYGIHSLCVSQMKRFFPMPDYDLSKPNEVILKIYGQSIDENYSKTLIQRGDLSLQDVILLDRVQKHLEINEYAVSELRKKKLVEGRKPNFFIGAKIAQLTGEKAAYTKNKGLNKQYYLDLILASIKQHNNLSRKDIDELLWEKLPDIYNDDQKKVKITNLIAELRQKGKITNQGTYTFPKWVIL